MSIPVFTDTWYQDTNGKLYFLSAKDLLIAYDENSVSPAYPKAGWTIITVAQAQLITNPPMPLTQLQLAQISILQASHAISMNAPVSFTTAAGVTSLYPSGNTLQCNGITALQNLAYVIDAGASAWTLGKWLDVNNVDQIFTFSDLENLAAAMEAVDVPVWSDLVSKIALVNAATTAAAIAAIV